MASVSSTSSLGNTALRGFGGMASGIDRDAIIEKMTLGTTTKINNQKKKITELQWKQEAYRGISDKIIDWADTYASYSSSKNLKDFTVFAKNQISIRGAESSTRFVSATGTSGMVNNVSLMGVKQLATSTVLRSAQHSNWGDGGIETKVNNLFDPVRTSNLAGGKISFSIYDGAGEKLISSASFTFAKTYKDEDGNTQNIDYTTKDLDQLVKTLNTHVLGESEAQLKTDSGAVDLKDVFEFANNNGNIVLQKKSTAPESVKGVVVEGGPTLKALGLGDGQKDDKGRVGFGADGKITMENKYEDKAVTEKSMINYLAGKKMTFNYDGSQKSIELITKDEAAKLSSMSLSDAKTAVAENLQERLNQAFGTGAVKVDFADNLSFDTANAGSTLSVVSNDYEMLDKIGLSYGASNKVNLSGTLSQSAFSGLGLDMSKPMELTINGKTIEGISWNSSISTILSKINSDTEAGVKATYVESTGEFMLVSSETGDGREINLDSELAEALFGGKREQSLNATLSDDSGVRFAEGKELSDYLQGNGNDLDLTINGVTIGGLTKDSTINEIISAINADSNMQNSGITAKITDEGTFVLLENDNEVALDAGQSSALANDLFGEDRSITLDTGLSKGQNAQILVSYGGTNVMVERSSNTFNLEGLNVTVSGEFGDVKGSNKSGWTSDTSQAITFSAKADVDGALEKVKSFIEDYNALVTEINKHVTTRPDRNYGALTDEQKAEMDETSIENWENKAKEGILYGDSAMRDLSMDVQSIFTKMMNNGASYEDLKEIGITYSEDWGDGGTLVFDETKFKTAMENDPEKVSNIFTGGGNVKKGLIDTIDETFIPYATRYGSKNDNGNGKGSYGRLIEIAGSEKKPTTLMENEIYKELKKMQETIDSLNERLKMEQDRYISQFTTMESLLNKMNTQSSYLSQLTA